MRCRYCDKELEELERDAEIKEALGNLENPSYYKKCPYCSKINHIKRRRKSGKIKNIRIVN
jgi:phage FluMu protein Com